MKENPPVINNDRHISPSTERRDEDIIALAKHYIKVAEEQINTGSKELSKEAEEYLLSHDWHGREKALETAVKKACILSEGNVIRVEDFDLGYRQIKSIGIGRFIEEKLKGFMRNIKNLDRFNLYETVIPEVEKALILMVMRETRWNQTRAARLLGINRNTLRAKIKKLKINYK
jgi:DNA-binding NtrC family response regulator